MTRSRTSIVKTFNTLIAESTQGFPHPIRLVVDDETALDGRKEKRARAASTADTVYISRRLLKDDEQRQTGVLAHELAHVFLLQHGNEHHSERHADEIAEELFGLRIYYDVEDIQTVGRGTWPRPARLDSRNNPAREGREGREEGLWRLNKIAGQWVRVRDVSPDTREEWLARFQQDEPNDEFKLSVNRPKFVGRFDRKKNPVEDEERVAREAGFDVREKKLAFDFDDAPIRRIVIEAPDEDAVKAIQLVERSRPETHYAVIHPNTQPGQQKWQVSWFDAEGAWGHTNRDTLTKAIKAARDDGYELALVERT